MITIACADCGRMQTLPPLPSGATAECERCDRLLAEKSPAGPMVTFACAAAILVLLPPAVFLPLMDSTIRNLVFQESRLVSSVSVIYTEVWFPFAFGFLFFAFLFPMIRALLQVVVIGSIRWRPLSLAGRLFRWSEELRIWSMTEVVVIAGVVAYFRAKIPARIEIRVGAWCYLAVAILAFVADRALDRRAVWGEILPDLQEYPGPKIVSCTVCELVVPERQAGEPCPRCGHTLDRRIAPRFIPAVAALLAALPLSIPAYSAAVMVNDQLTAVIEHTVLGTVQLLADRGYWQYGIVVLVAGIVIPIAELVGIAWLLLRTYFPSRRGLVLRTRLYRILHRLMRWPMIIPFIAALAAPIVKYRGIDDIWAGPGATPLFLIIALAMVALRLFEPRFMWQTAGEPR